MNTHCSTSYINTVCALQCVVLWYARTCTLLHTARVVGIGAQPLEAVHDQLLQTHIVRAHLFFTSKNTMLKRNWLNSKMQLDQVIEYLGADVVELLGGGVLRDLNGLFDGLRSGAGALARVLVVLARDLEVLLSLM